MNWVFTENKKTQKFINFVNGWWFPLTMSKPLTVAMSRRPLCSSLGIPRGTVNSISKIQRTLIIL